MKIRISFFRWAAATVGLLMLSQASAEDVTRNAEWKPHPRIVLQRPAVSPRAPRNTKNPQPVREVGGLELIGLLGNQINDLANYHNLTPAELSSIIERDSSLKANEDGALFYVCPPVTASQRAAIVARLGATAKAPPFPLDQSFKLHSRTGTNKVIYLDFKGHTTTGTAWNNTYGKTIVTPPYDIDGDPNNFSDTELTNIQEIWQRISEDFSPFNVDVTTEDPGVANIIKTDANDTRYGIRLCIGGSANDWLHASAGGVTMLNSFGSSKDTPAFVFVKETGTASKGPGEAGAHELGHSFGLTHQGQTNGTEYYLGQGDWAPIMGASYYKPITQWAKGEYPLANNTEDAVAKIAAYVPYRTDKPNNKLSTATDLAGSSYNVSDILEKRADVDYYNFLTRPGQVSFTVTTAVPEGDLAAKLSLYDGSGTLVATSDPDPLAGFGTTLTQTVPQGVYYIAVEGVGMGDVKTTGFTDYASLGQYTLTGSAAPSNLKLPFAVATSSAPLAGRAPLTVNFSSLGSFDFDGTITKYLWKFGDGGTSYLANPVHTYSKVGVYTATLIVFDNDNLSNATTVIVDSQSINGPAGLHVDDIKLVLYKSWVYGYYVKAVVVVRNQDGLVIPGAEVAATWSGPVTGTLTGTTNSGGMVTMWTNTAFSTRTTVTSDGTAKRKTDAEMNRGTFTFTVTGVAKTGYAYQAGSNKLTSASVKTP